MDQIEIEMFKCFEVLKLPLKPLTLFSGSNASGKSTVLQALVLLHQTILEHEWSTRLQLNGSAIALGSAADVVDKVNGRSAFAIRIVDSSCTIRWNFDFGDNKQSMSIAVNSLEVDGREIIRPDRLRHLFPDPATNPQQALARRLKRLSYLTAERVGPREIYQLQDPSAAQVVGARGENAVGLLHLKRDDKVLPTLVVDSEPPTLLKQVQARMSQFFPDTSLDVQKVPQTNIVTLGLRTSNATEFHRPVNVGFGLTQVLPIIVASLSAQVGDLLLVENPEVHLHPAGQALMGKFLSETSAAGIQVLVETHSDHVLNGIRRAVKSRIVSPEQVALHFFKPRGTGGEQVTTPMLDASGNVDQWPNGFFDQFDKDMNFFAGWGE